MGYGHNYQWREQRLWYAPWRKRTIMRCANCGQNPGRNGLLREQVMSELSPMQSIGPEGQIYYDGHPTGRFTWDMC
jgi:hypothetical protein